MDDHKNAYLFTSLLCALSGYRAKEEIVGVTNLPCFSALHGATHTAIPEAVVCAADRKHSKGGKREMTNQEIADRELIPAVHSIEDFVERARANERIKAAKDRKEAKKRKVHCLQTPLRQCERSITFPVE